MMNLIESVKEAVFFSMEEETRIQSDEPISHVVTFKIDYDLSKIENNELMKAIESCGLELQEACKDKLIEQVHLNSMIAIQYAYEMDLKNEEAIEQLINYYNGDEFTQIIIERDFDITGKNTFSISDL